MIRSIVFDFDGVILESANIKSEAFRELFREYPEKEEDILNYHIKNGGISRFVKFRYIYNNILGKKISDEEQTKLGERFSDIVFQKVLNVPFVPGAKEFLGRNQGGYEFFIASGTPEDELHAIVSKRNLWDYFREVHGSPRYKEEIIKEILANHHFDESEVVYIGDAESDRIAAEETGILFIERREDLDPDERGVRNAIKDLTGLEEILNKLNEEVTDNKS